MACRRKAQPLKVCATWRQLVFDVGVLPMPIISASHSCTILGISNHIIQVPCPFLILSISTSYAERQHLTMRMGMRRFTRLTNAFSKKVENHAYQVALHFMHYNFCRIHKSLRVTTAMEAGITDHAW